MHFTVTGLSPDPFKHLYGLPDAELAAFRARRVIAGESGYPERIELRDADPGETLLLVNYEHQDADSPFRASHAVYVREGATETASITGLPDVLRRRLLSLRAFADDGMMVDADVVEGESATPVIERMLSDDRIAYVHAHSARPGCYLARIDRTA